MKLVTALAILLISSILVFPVSLRADDDGVVTAKKAKVYAKPDAKSKVVKTLTKGDKVSVTDQKKDWFQIEFDGKTGWIQKKNLSVGSQEEEEKPEPVKSKKQVSSDDEEEAPPPKRSKSSSSSSSSEPGFLGFGIRLGFNLASLSGDDLKKANILNSSSRFGLVAGGIILLNFDNMFALQTEILYSQQGAKNNDSTLKFDYLSVPILFKFTAPIDFEIKPFATVGPYLGFSMNRALKTKDSTYVYADSTIKKIDYGLSLGLGAAYQLMPHHNIMMDFRYNLGLASIAEAYSIKNRAFFISVGYIIEF